MGYENDLYDNLDKLLKQTGLVYLTGTLFLAISLIFGCFSVCLAVALIKKKCFKCSCFLHVNWMCLGVLGIIYLILGMVISCVAIGLVNICDVMETVLTDEVAFNNIAGGKLADFDDMITTCLFGDGNLKDILPVKDSFTDLDTFDKDIE